MSSTTSDKKTRPIFYVYVLTDPCKPGRYKYGRWTFKHEPFYVGKGFGDRAKASASGTKQCNQHKLNRIKKIQTTAGSDPILVIKKQGLTEAEAFDLERRMVLKIGRRDLKTGPLTNWTDGGDGSVGKKKKPGSGWIHNKSPEEVAAYKKKLSDAVRASHAKATPEQKEQRRQAMIEGLASMSTAAKKRREKARAAAFDKYWASLTAEQRAEVFKTRAATYKRKPQEELDWINALRAVASTTWHASLSDAQKKKLVKVWSLRRKQFWERKRENRNS